MDTDLSVFRGNRKLVARWQNLTGRNRRLPERINKLQPDRTLALRGFNSFAAAASIHSASPTGFQVSGTFRDPADFAVAVLYDADNYYEHPSIKYLPDFNFAGLTLNFSLSYSDGVQPIDSPKYNWIDWATLDAIRADGTAASINLFNNSMLAGSVFPAASASFNVITGSAIQPYDRVTLWFQNIAFDYIVPGTWPISAAFQFFAGSPGAVHSITVNGRPYGCTEFTGDSSSTVAAALGAHQRCSRSLGLSPRGCIHQHCFAFGSVRQRRQACRSRRFGRKRGRGHLRIFTGDGRRADSRRHQCHQLGRAEHPSRPPRLKQRRAGDGNGRAVWHGKREGDIGRMGEWRLVFGDNRRIFHTDRRPLVYRGKRPVANGSDSHNRSFFRGSRGRIRSGPRRPGRQHDPALCAGQKSRHTLAGPDDHPAFRGKFRRDVELLARFHGPRNRPAAAMLADLRPVACLWRGLYSD